MEGRIFNCNINDIDDRFVDHRVESVIEKQEEKTHKLWRCSVVLDQGQEGSCAGHAGAHELIAEPYEMEDVDHEFAKEKIYWLAQQLDEWEGGSYQGATEFYEGTSILAVSKAAKQLGLISSYKWAMTFDEFIDGLLYTGPAVIGVNWYKGMGNTNRNGYISVSGVRTGGHAVLVRGIDTKKGVFVIRNSWGGAWGVSINEKDSGLYKSFLGDGGDCFIPFKDMYRLLFIERGQAAFWFDCDIKSVK